MSGFDEIFKDFENDIRIASHIPAEHRSRAIEAAAGTAALRAGWHTISRVFFDDNSSTWRDGKGNIVPAPSERGDSNRVFSRGMMLETGASRPVYNKKAGRWLDKHPQRPLDSDDSDVVEAHLRDVFESNKNPISAEEARGMREFYERTPGGPKLPHYGGKEGAVARKALEKLRQPAALPLDTVAESSSTSSSPPVLVDNKERGRPALDERHRRVRPYSGDEIAAPLGDDDDGPVHLRFDSDADEAPVTRYGVTRRNGQFFMSYQGREFAIPDSDPQEYSRHWQAELADTFGDDVVFGGAVMRGTSLLFRAHGAQYVREINREGNFSEDELAAVVRKSTQIFGKPQDVEEAERRARFSGGPAAHRPLAPKRHVSELVDSMWANRPAKVSRHVGPAADEKAAPAPPRSAPVAPVAVQEDGPGRIPFQYEIEVNDAAGAPYQGPAYFDSDPIKSRLERLGGEFTSAASVLLHEDQVEVNRKRRWVSRVLVAKDVQLSYFGFSGLYLDQDAVSFEESPLDAPYGDMMDADMNLMTKARVSAIWCSSSTKALVACRSIAGASGLTLESRYLGEHSWLADVGERAYAGLFLTYVPQGSGVSERRGLQVNANYLQFRFVLSPAYLVGLAFRRGGTNDFVQPSFPYSSTPTQMTSGEWPSSTQALLTIHRVMFVLCTDPLLKFSDVVVDGLDIHSPVSLHTRGVLEVLKDVYVSSDKDEVHSVNLQLKGRAFYYTSSPAVRKAAAYQHNKSYDMVRGYHILALHSAAVVSFPVDFYNAAAGSGGTNYKSYLASLSIPPACTLSSSFSFSDA